MTNAQIIEAHSFGLLERGIIRGTGNFVMATDAEGNEIRLEIPEAIHTFQRWRELGYSVRRGEKAVDTFLIWKHSARMLSEDTGNAELDKANAAINAEGGKQSMFMKRSAFFAAHQVEPLKA